MCVIFREYNSFSRTSNSMSCSESLAQTEMAPEHDEGARQRRERVSRDWPERCVRVGKRANNGTKLEINERNG